MVSGTVFGDGKEGGCQRNEWEEQDEPNLKKSGRYLVGKWEEKGEREGNVRSRFRVVFCLRTSATADALRLVVILSFSFSLVIRKKVEGRWR